jgi:hypothetical protein
MPLFTDTYGDFVLLLKKLIPQLIKPKPPASAVRQVVRICHSLAISYLRQKAGARRFDSNFFGMSIDDLAMDCIANMFERDDRGNFVRIRSYFKGIEIENDTEEQLLIHLRRLVFTIVNDELFRIYRAQDPSLSHIIRNIKTSLKYIPEVIAERADGDVWLYLENETPEEAERPIIPYEFLRLHLYARFSATMSLTAILMEIITIINEQDHYRKRYPITAIALLVRSLLATKVESGLVEYPSDETLRSDEIRGFLHECVEEVRNRMHDCYVPAGKVTEKQYDAYFRAIEDILVAQYVNNDGFDRSFYDYVRSYLRRLSVSEYRRTHRSYFEYLVKLSRKELLKKISQEI